MSKGLHTLTRRPHDEGSRRRAVRLALKLGCDMFVAAVLLIAVSPVMVLIALSIRLESRGPVFYRARRVGYRGAPVHILKFRKMHHGAVGRPLTVDCDHRFTRMGGWLARTKLDELPQLINVVRGEMSLIGPRPEDPDFVQRHACAFEPILQARPGITGLSQLAFAAEAQVLDPSDPVRHYEARILPQKLQLDELYVSRRSLGLDARILGWTLVATLLRIPVAVDRSTGQMSVRRRPKRPSTRRGLEATVDHGARRPEVATPDPAVSAAAR